MSNASSNTSLHCLQSHSFLMASLLALVLLMAISLSACMGYMKIAWMDVWCVVGGSLTGNLGMVADVGLSSAFLLVGLLVFVFYARDLNLLCLGRRATASLGVDARRVPWILQP